MSDPLMMCFTCYWVGRDAIETPPPTTGLLRWCCPVCGDPSCYLLPPKLAYAFAGMVEIEKPGEAIKAFCDSRTQDLPWWSRGFLKHFCDYILTRARAATSQIVAVAESAMEEVDDQ